MKPVCIVGCGYIGRRLAQRLLPDERAITGVVRSPESAEQLEMLGIAALQIDLDNLPPAAIPTRHAELYYFAPPPPTGETDARLRAFLDSIPANALPHRLVYISTSGVYGDCQGEWIDESRPVQPGTPRGRRRADAEQALLVWSAATCVPVVILRVPGIYGPGKLPLARLKKGLPLLREEDSPYTNRIHADDLVTACLAAMDHGEPGEAYNVSDGHPSNMTDYFNRIADQAGLPRPPTVSREEAATALTEGMRSFMDESKRLDNRRLREELGVELQYETLDKGLAQALAEQAGNG